jgi:hypothetical protein
MQNISDTRIARTEALFRDVNERIAESAQRFGSDDASFVCECADVSCTSRVDAPMETYDDVREDGAQFLVADGHQLDGVERVVDRKKDFVVVEKVKPTVRRLVKRLDPRTRPA